MLRRIPRTIVHYSRNDPRTTRGGVETFARSLALIFEHVELMTPETRDELRVRRERLPVVCDNHMVLDWPEDLRVIGFQHGVAWRKARVTRSLYDLQLAVRQLRATRRPNVIWVACAAWIAHAFAPLTRCVSQRVIYHPVDLERFDGKLDNADSKLILHDARSPHKGQKLVAELSGQLPDYCFEPLDCEPHEVPDRMRRALAFLHLSRYEGNSIVCNEAMAMDLPCLFTRVGLMLDIEQSFDVVTVDAKQAFSSPRQLTEQVRAFLARAKQGQLKPRAWPARHANLDVTTRAWTEVMQAFDAEAPP